MTGPEEATRSPRVNRAPPPPHVVIARKASYFRARGSDLAVQRHRPLPTSGEEAWIGNEWNVLIDRVLRSSKMPMDGKPLLVQN